MAYGPPILCHMNRFYWGWGVVFNLLIYGGIAEIVSPIAAYWPTKGFKEALGCQGRGPRKESMPQKKQHQHSTRVSTGVGHGHQGAVWRTIATVVSKAEGLSWACTP